MTIPLFSNLQTDLIARAADLVDENSREAFWRTIAARLAGETYPHDNAVRSAISFALSSRGIAAGSALLETRPVHKPIRRKFRPPLGGALRAPR